MSKNILRKGAVIFVFAHTLLFAAAQPVTRLRIDPAAAYGGSVSDYFDEIEYIPLETTQESLFGNISQLIVGDSGFVIYDRDTRSVLFFKNDGKFIRKEVISAKFIFTILYRYNKSILVACSSSDATNMYLREYSENGKLLSEQMKADPNSIQKKFFFPLKKDYFLSFNSCNQDFDGNKKIIDSNAYLIDIYKKENFYKSLLPYHVNTKRVFCKLEGRLAFSLNMKIEGDVFYIATPMEHIIYKVSIDTAIPKYQFIFPREYDIDRNIFNKSQDFIDSISRVGNYYKDITVNNIGDINVSDKNIFFKINYYSKIPFKDGLLMSSNFIYNLKKQKLTAIDKITSDNSNCYLPTFNKERISSYGINYYNGNYYAFNSSLEMFTAQNATREKHPTYTPVMQEYFRTQDRKANPVIVRMKLTK